MAIVCGAKMPRKAGDVRWTALLLAALFAVAAVEAAPAAKSPPSPAKSKPPPKPVVLKPPPKPVISKPPPKPFKSKPPPKAPPVHVDPFFCQSCATVFVSQYYQQVEKNVTISEATCNSIADRIGDKLNGTLLAGGATVLSTEPDCSSRQQVRVCVQYYFWKLNLPSNTGDQLAGGWVWELPPSAYCNKRGMWAATIVDLTGATGACLSGHSAVTVACD